MRAVVLVLVLVGCGGGGSEKSCDTSARCSTEAPYCVAEACSTTCAGDTECPGFGQSAAEKFCVSGACVTCRAGMAEDCSAASPVCDDGQCRRCERNDECASGACANDGTCVAETSIAYASPTGGATAACTRMDPCSLTQAVQLAPPRQFIVLSGGTHTLAASLTMAGTRNLIGSGMPRPIITNGATGSIIKLALGADVTFEHVELSGARTNANFEGYAILCPDGNITARIKDAIIRQNADAGIEGRNCTVEISNSTFTNTGRAVSIVDSKARIDRSTFTGNTTALFLDAGLFIVTNNFIVRNQEGLDLFANEGTIVEHNTIVDNSMFGARCQFFSPDDETTLSMPNNLFARNNPNIGGMFKCSFPNSITAGTDIGPIKFKSPDVAPFDYHITAGSSALDLAATSSLTVDFDGEARPNGTAGDIGADELH